MFRASQDGSSAAKPIIVHAGIDGFRLRSTHPTDYGLAGRLDGERIGRARRVASSAPSAGRFMRAHQACGHLAVAGHHAFVRRKRPAIGVGTQAAPCGQIVASYRQQRLCRGGKQACDEYEGGREQEVPCHDCYSLERTMFLQPARSRSNRRARAGMGPFKPMPRGEATGIARAGRAGRQGKPELASRHCSRVLARTDA